MVNDRVVENGFFDNLAIYDNFCNPKKPVICVQYIKFSVS
jgi:hypothetical protein